tara:strand:- start:189 stop:509 length:321 start_codon:yes stop_codon:yes gene_type:complete
MAKTTRESYRLMLRIPDELRDRLRKSSDSNGRTLTAEIIYRLEESFKGIGVIANENRSIPFKFYNKEFQFDDLKEEEIIDQIHSLSALIMDASESLYRKQKSSPKN